MSARKTRRGKESELDVADATGPAPPFSGLVDRLRGRPARSSARPSNPGSWPARRAARETTRATSRSLKLFLLFRKPWKSVSFQPSVAEVLGDLPRGRDEGPAVRLREGLVGPVAAVVVSLHRAGPVLVQGEIEALDRHPLARQVGERRAVEQRAEPAVPGGPVEPLCRPSAGAQPSWMRPFWLYGSRLSTVRCRWASGNSPARSPAGRSSSSRAGS